MTAKTKLTIPDLIKRKRDKERVVMVAIADFLMAGWAERAGVDVIGVGDSLWSHKDFAMLITPRIPNSLEYFSPDIQEDQVVLRVYINNKKAAGGS